MKQPSYENDCVHRHSGARGQKTGKYKTFGHHLKMYSSHFGKQCCCYLQLVLNKFISILQKCYNDKKAASEESLPHFSTCTNVCFKCLQWCGLLWVSMYCRKIDVLLADWCKIKMHNMSKSESLKCGGQWFVCINLHPDTPADTSKNTTVYSSFYTSYIHLTAIISAGCSTNCQKNSTRTL